MPHNEALAAKVRAALSGTKGLTEKKMFGGVAFLVNGAMCIGVNKNDLIVRCAKDETDDLLERAGVRRFDLSGGRPMKGWLLVGPEGMRSSAAFKGWVSFARAWATQSDVDGDGAGGSAMSSSAQSLFWKLAADLQRRDPRIREGTIMNGRCLRVDTEFLALVDYKGSGLVVKLPAKRAAELIDAGVGKPFAPAGKVFKEWLSVPLPNAKLWRQLLREGVVFVSR